MLISCDVVGLNLKKGEYEYFPQRELKILELYRYKNKE